MPEYTKMNLQTETYRWVRNYLIDLKKNIGVKFVQQIANIFNGSTYVSEKQAEEIIAVSSQFENANRTIDFLLSQTPDIPASDD